MKLNISNSVMCRFLLIILMNIGCFFIEKPVKANVRIDFNRLKPINIGKTPFQNKMLFIEIKDGKYFFRIPDTLLGRDILVVNRILKSGVQLRKPEDGGGYAMDIISEKVIRFEKGPRGKIFLKQISYLEPPGDSLNTMHQSILQSNTQAIVMAFDNKEQTSQHSVLIEVSDLIKGDNDLLFFGEKEKRGYRLGSFQPDKSFVDTVQSFSENVEIKAAKTYSRIPSTALVYPPPPVEASFATVELNSSWILLPKIPMKPRMADDRIGYYTADCIDYSINPYGVKKVRMITRWRLEPKPEDISRYLNGELVEPKKPIVFYIDPTTPAKWAPYIMKGINAWQKAFEKAGFKNAIYALKAPQNDASWSIADAKHSAMIWVPSAMANGSGFHVHDPRSGEIIESHANLDHNITSILQKWYTIQAGAIDPRARKPVFDDELMGKLIAYVSSHEVGHALGFPHNYLASSTVQVEKLRDKTWVEAHGHTPSIMDYARFNYVAQPEDGITEPGILPRIGAYDEWAVEWGYRWFPENTKEQPVLNKLVLERTNQNITLRHSPENGPDDPRNLNIDLGDDAMLAGRYGIKNLKRILPNLLDWTYEEGQNFEKTKEMYLQLLDQFGAYTSFARANIGGTYYNQLTADQQGAAVEFVPKAIQKRAMAFLQQELFSTPEWLMNHKLFDKIGESGLEAIGKQQSLELGRILSTNTLNTLLKFEANDGQNAYTLNEMLTELQTGLFSEVKLMQPISMPRRDLQKLFVEKMQVLIAPQKSTYGQSNPLTLDISSEIKSQLKALHTIIATALPNIRDAQTQKHLSDLKERLK